MNDDKENHVAKRQENGECRCGAPGEPEHPCPFSQEIHGDHKRMCNCCRACEQRCIQDI